MIVTIVLQNHPLKIKLFKFYTGINKQVFKSILKYGPSDIINRKLRVADHLLLVIVRVRMDLSGRDITYRSQVSASAVSV